MRNIVLGTLLASITVFGVAAAKSDTNKTIPASNAKHTATAHASTHTKPHATTSANHGPAVHRPTAHAGAKTATSTRSGSKTSGRTSRSARNRRSKTTRKPAARATQTAPTPERYKEIQQALIDRRYLNAEANGVWGPDSAAALKKFQSDQKLDPTGKLDSLSLIGLGLGPKRVSPITAPASASAPAAPNAQPAPAVHPEPAAPNPDASPESPRSNSSASSTE